MIHGEGGNTECGDSKMGLARETKREITGIDIEEILLSTGCWNGDNFFGWSEVKWFCPRQLKSNGLWERLRI